MNRAIICGLSEDEIYDLLEPYGFTRAHSHEIAVNLYKRKFIDFSDFTGIPERLREHLKIHFSTGLFSFRESHLSEDKSVNISSEQMTAKSLKLFIFLTGKGILYVYQHSRDAGWDVHFVYQGVMVSMAT